MDTWGKVKRYNSRRRYFKVLGRLPEPYGLALEDYGEIYNVVIVEFDWLDISVFPPLVTRRCRTGFVSDMESQARYGQWDLVLRVGSMTAKGAKAYRDEYLKQHAQPEFHIDGTCSRRR